jgi:energy-converting hydrogenase Eha subunit E
MTTNQLAGMVLIVVGLIDLIIVPKMMDAVWRKAKRRPPWTESLNMVIRIIGVVFLFFGISYYFYGQLE